MQDPGAAALHVGVKSCPAEGEAECGSECGSDELVDGADFQTRPCRP